MVWRWIFIQLDCRIEGRKATRFECKRIRDLPILKIELVGFSRIFSVGGKMCCWLLCKWIFGRAGNGKSYRIESVMNCNQIRYLWVPTKKYLYLVKLYCEFPSTYLTKSSHIFSSGTYMITPPASSPLPRIANPALAPTPEFAGNFPRENVTAWKRASLCASAKWMTPCMRAQLRRRNQKKGGQPPNWRQKRPAKSRKWCRCKSLSVFFGLEYWSLIRLVFVSYNNHQFPNLDGQTISYSEVRNSRDICCDIFHGSAVIESQGHRSSIYFSWKYSPWSFGKPWKKLTTDLSLRKSGFKNRNHTFVVGLEVNHKQKRPVETTIPKHWNK